MSRYSFLLASEEPEYFELTPTIRLKKHNGWLVAESIEQEEISKVQSQSTIKAVQLAKKIAAAKGIPLDEAFALLQGGGSESELLSEYAEEALSLMNSGSSVEYANARLVTTFIRCRGEGKKDGKWVSLSDWTMDDTKEMTRPLMAKMSDFITSEQDEEVKEAQAKKSRKKTTEAAEPSN